MREPLTGPERFALKAASFRWDNDRRPADARQLADAFGALMAERDRLEDERNTARAELAAPVADEDVQLTLRVLKAGDGTRRDGELLERAIRQAEAGRERLAADRAYIAAAIDRWQDGTDAPHDVLTAIRDRLTGESGGGQ